MTEQNTQTGADAGANAKPEFALQRIYLKDLSFEAPQGPEAFKRQWKPQVNQDLRTQIKRLEDDHYDVVLHITVTVKEGDEVMYLVEVQQAGIFLLRGFEGQQLTSVLNTHCPQIIFPYLRETVDSVVNKGTFPALMLPPINFEALFQQALAQAQAQQSAPETVN
ncbi:MAG: protein-export chaperone SecB [Porticoccaceae bacterium]